VRLLLDQEGRDLAGMIGHQPLNQLLETVTRNTGQKMVRLAREQISAQLKQADPLVANALVKLRGEALEQLKQQRSAEYQRLAALAEVNPMVRPEELAALQSDTEQMAAALESAELRLDAIRLILVRE
jgi:ATP-dependent helicase HepA